MIYLDSAATARPRAEAIAAVEKALKDTWGTPSASYGPGREARALLEESRKTLLRALGAKSGTLIFPSGGTREQNWAKGSMISCWSL